ncbi:MAG: hypothetical protein IT341_08210, partial [Chloroflexi bacterium]|nr:hypothetical protein [Chloroflexota bacterium]
AIGVVKDALNPDDFAQAVALGLDVNGVRTTLEEQLAALEAAHDEAEERNAAAKEEQRRTADLLRSEGQLSRNAIGRVSEKTEAMRATAERQRLDAISSDSAMLGTLHQIRDKNAKIAVTVNTSITVSAAAMNKQLTSYRESSGSGGFI